MRRNLLTQLLGGEALLLEHARALDIIAAALIAWGPVVSLILSARDPAAYELQRRRTLASRPMDQDLRRTGVRFLIAAPALFWAWHRAEFSLLWLLLGCFLILGALMCLAVSYSEAARSFERDSSFLQEERSVLARKRRITQAVQITLLGVWAFAWRELAT
jgi:hypothetical protein